MQAETTSPLTQEVCEATLKRFDAYIVSQVRHLRNTHLLAAHPTVLDLELDDLIQRVRINFWQALARRHIEHPYAYIKRMIHNELVTISRQQKHLIPLPADEEWGEREIKEPQDLSAPDPAEEVEHQQEALSCLHQVIQAILALPPRQRLAMICSLQERVDDRAQLVYAFKMQQVDIEMMHWPTEKKEKHLVQASLTHARKALARKLRKYCL